MEKPLDCRDIKKQVWDLVMEYVDERYEPNWVDHKEDLQEIVKAIMDLAVQAEYRCDAEADAIRNAKRGDD